MLLSEAGVLFAGNCTHEGVEVSSVTFDQVFGSTKGRKKREEEVKRIRRFPQTAIVSLMGASLQAVTSGELSAARSGMRYIPRGDVELSARQCARLDKQYGTTATVGAFWIDTVEVPQAEFEKLLGFNPSLLTVGDRFPVDWVNWYGAALFCNARSKALGLDTVYSYDSAWALGKGSTKGRMLRNVRYEASRNGFRLPSELQWSRACMAGATTRYFWGECDSLAAEYSWYTKNSNRNTHPVASREPNRFGLYDMVGNVAEWLNEVDSSCECSKPKRYSRPCRAPDRSCREGEVRKTRPMARQIGGNFNSHSLELTCGSSLWSYSDEGIQVGFRCVLPGGKPTTPRLRAGEAYVANPGDLCGTWEDEQKGRQWTFRFGEDGRATGRLRAFQGADVAVGTVDTVSYIARFDREPFYVEFSKDDSLIGSVYVRFLSRNKVIVKPRTRRDHYEGFSPGFEKEVLLLYRFNEPPLKPGTGIVDTALVNRRWHIKEIRDGEGKSDPVVANAIQDSAGRASITFGSKGHRTRKGRIVFRYACENFCNSGSGAYANDSGSFTIGRMRMTQVFCSNGHFPELIMYEDTLADRLARTNGYSIDKDGLVLLQEDGSSVVLVVDTSCVTSTGFRSTEAFCGEIARRRKKYQRKPHGEEKRKYYEEKLRPLWKCSSRACP